MPFKNIKGPAEIAQEKAQKEAEERTKELQRLLAETDYIALSDYDKDQPEIKAKRAAWRQEIREITDAPV